MPRAFRIGLLQPPSAYIGERGGLPGRLPSSATVTAEIEFGIFTRARLESGRSTADSDACEAVIIRRR